MRSVTVTEQEQTIEKACALLHAHFEDEANDYSEREESDVEYFVGVIMYNHFSFSKALPTMKTMDVGSDFIKAAGESYIEVCALIDSIKSSDELELLALLQNHIKRSLKKYENDPMSCYLLNRLEKHIDNLAGIYAGEVRAEDVDFMKQKGFGR
jgi:hypothetical protein